VRIPNSYTFAKALVRLYHDGEPRTFELKKKKSNDHESWWEVSVVVLNKTLSYRFVFIDKGKYNWLNAAGLFDYDVHSNNDFQIVAIPAYPQWIKSSVFYQNQEINKNFQSGHTHEIGTNFQEGAANTPELSSMAVTSKGFNNIWITSASSV
jgi:hypothetical protein